MTLPNALSISALILAGGRARRMNGIDKGLVDLDGRPMIQHVLERLRPQVETVRINANRSLEHYEALGPAVISDRLSDYQGPLAGMARGLEQAGGEQAGEEWLLVVPCDTPYLPLDLAARLLDAVEREESEIAVAHDGQRLQPVVCLLHTSLGDSLERFLDQGGRKIDRWFEGHRMSPVDFSDQPEAFININSLQDKQLLVRQPVERPVERPVKSGAA